MAISYTKVDIRGKAFDPVLTEILFKNKTISDNLVTFATDVKASTIFTENTNTTTQQAFTCGAPSATGSIALTDIEITPTKIMYYDEFCYDNLRLGRFNRSMKPGAWEIISDEFNRTVLDNVSNGIAADVENKFWNGSTSATKTAVGLTVSGVTSREMAYVAASTTSLIDGVVTRMIYNNSVVGGRVSVAGVTISSSTIATEYGRLYAAIPAITIGNGVEQPYIYAPRSHKQFINIYNVAATYRDLFAVNGLGTPNESYFYNGIEIKFVPLPENCMIVALPSNIIFATDLVSDINYLMIDKIANNREDYFYKAIFTYFAHVVRQSMNVLYI
tara:strand:- start:426 stop:1418 length:993 start_codon:yes stop_codon:yes gene_type:complete